MIPFLAAAAPEVTPTSVGVFVLIALQLSQFLFAYKKDSRDGQAVLKSDLTDLKKELKMEISLVANDVDDLRTSVEKKMENSGKDSVTARSSLTSKIQSVELKTAALVEGQETMKQTLISQGGKLDRLLSLRP